MGQGVTWRDSVVTCIFVPARSPTCQPVGWTQGPPSPEWSTPSTPRARASCSPSAPSQYRTRPRRGLVSGTSLFSEQNKTNCLGHDTWIVFFCAKWSEEEQDCVFSFVLSQSSLVCYYMFYNGSSALVCRECSFCYFLFKLQDITI